MEGQVVRFRDCACPGTPHPEGDTVTLRPYLGFTAGAEALRILIAASGDQTFLDETLGPVYLREGPLEWNVLDESGPVPMDVESLPYEEAVVIVDAADQLYSERVMRPLLQRLNESSPAGRTGTTSATRRSSQKARKPVSRSSPVTSGDGIATAP